MNYPLFVILKRGEANKIGSQLNYSKFINGRGLLRLISNDKCSWGDFCSKLEMIGN